MSSGKVYTEEELVRLLQQGDKSSLDYLYDKYSAVLYGIILKIMNGEEKGAEDVFQEVFVKIWNSIKTFDRKKSSLLIWMIKIAREVSLDKEHLDTGESIRSHTSNVYAINGEVNNLVIDQVEVESPVKSVHKTIFDMAFYGGFTQKEISEKLNIPMEKVCIEARAAIIEIRNKFS